MHTQTHTLRCQRISRSRQRHGHRDARAKTINQFISIYIDLFQCSECARASARAYGTLFSDDALLMCSLAIDLVSESQPLRCLGTLLAVVVRAFFYMYTVYTLLLLRCRSFHVAINNVKRSNNAKIRKKCNKISLNTI